MSKTQNAINYNGIINVVNASFTASQINGMFTTPLQILAAPGANLAIICIAGILNYIGGSAAFTGGGNLKCQYGNAGGGNGASCFYDSNVFAAVTMLTSGTTNQVAMQIAGPVDLLTNSSTYVNTGVYLTNKSAVFSGGTGATVNMTIQYVVVPLS